MVKKPNLWIIWYQMPQYGGDIVSYAAQYFDISIFITAPAFPFNLKISNKVSIYRNEIPSGDPDCLVSCGAFTPFLKRVKRVAGIRGAKIILASDNCDKEPLWKILLKRVMSIPYNKIPMLVPGRSGRRYASALGFNYVAEGLYAAAPLLNESQKASIVSLDRDNTIIFVGQLNRRKNVETLINAFLIADLADWRLCVIGDGPLLDSLPRDTRIDYLGFNQPEDVHKSLLKSKIFVLPSLEEHWGVVVLEAAAAGCALCLSEEVGAADDLVTPANGAIFDPTDCNALTARFHQMTAMSDSWYENASKVSIELSQAFTPDLFVNSVSELMELHDANY